MVVLHDPREPCSGAKTEQGSAPQLCALSVSAKHEVAAPLRLKPWLQVKEHEAPEGSRELQLPSVPLEGARTGQGLGAHVCVVRLPAKHEVELPTTAKPVSHRT
jgi:hypothetical protein